MSKKRKTRKQKQLTSDRRIHVINDIPVKITDQKSENILSVDPALIRQDLKKTLILSIIFISVILSLYLALNHQLINVF